jgi:hypothetical protein
MSKWGWKNITERYFAATELVHDNVTFGSKVRQLKALWRNIQKLQNKCTGLGRSADGCINASDEWWEENTKVQQDLGRQHLSLILTELLLPYFGF